MPKRPEDYKSPEAFRQALEQKIRDEASTKRTTIDRIRRLFLFDRFLGRVLAVLGARVVVKGGYALELRLSRARTTKDIDLRLTGTPDGLLAELQTAGRRDEGDFLSFDVEPDKEKPTIENDGLKYDGFRFKIQARLGGKPYGNPFRLDAAFADPIEGKPEILEGSSLLTSMGIEPNKIPVYPRETHVAEKLHAYTLEYGTENSRVKDLPDLALLASLGSLDAEQLRAAIERTFTHRGTHSVPASFPDPPRTWSAPYERLAKENVLDWRDLESVTSAVRKFLDPILGGERTSLDTWNHETWSWHRVVIAKGETMAEPDSEASDKVDVLVRMILASSLGKDDPWWSTWALAWLNTRHKPDDRTVKLSGDALQKLEGVCRPTGSRSNNRREALYKSAFARHQVLLLASVVGSGVPAAQKRETVNTTSQTIATYLEEAIGGLFP